MTAWVNKRSNSSHQFSSSARLMDVNKEIQSINGAYNTVLLLMVNVTQASPSIIT